MHADPMAAWGGYGPHVIWNCVRLLFTKATMWGREGRAWAPNPMPGVRYCPPLSFVSPRFRRGLILLEACASRTKLWLSSILLLSGGAGAFGKNDLAGVDIIIIPGSQGLPGGGVGARGCTCARLWVPRECAGAWVRVLSTQGGWPLFIATSFTSLVRTIVNM